MPESTPEPAQKKEKKSIYDVGFAPIFFKNFLEGFARGLGMIVAYVLLGGLVYYLALTYILPQLQNVLKTKLPLFTPTIQVNPGNANLPESQESVSKE